MELHVYLAFVVAAAIMIALPGPSVLLTVAHSMSSGWQHARSTVAGATMGIAVELIVTAIGLTALLNVVAEAFEWIRWAGAAFLVDLFHLMGDAAEGRRIWEKRHLCQDRR